ncbi:MAG: hypothetical protein OEV43_01260 [Coriobacteriia bacterium]|nr:hypothetical protein [Coriobacteriia bacterium]
MSKNSRSDSEGRPAVRYKYAARPLRTKTKRPFWKSGSALLALLAIAGLAFAAGWNPPTTTVHSFTEASDYRADRDSGCTNSGEGCHGSESSYADFNAYHPDTECTTCHKYQGVGCIPCHEPENNECVTCHDGTMPNAPDCVRLSEPYPRGHYRETTHTAMGTDMSVVVRTVGDGEAGLECGECHARDMRKAHTGVPAVEGSEYGDDVNCGECHNDTRCFGLEQVSSDWEGRRCEDCHREDSSSPMHSSDIATSIEPSGTPGCGATGKGCHEIDDVHGLHPNLPKDCSGSAKDDEPGCHDLEVESHKPTATACGGEGDGTCHLGYEPDELTHKNDAALHSAETRYPASDTSFNGVACGDCHFMEPDGVSLVTEHDVWTSQKTVVGDDGCRNCHNHLASLEAIENDWELRDTRESCDACHGTYTLDGAHAGDLTSLHVAYNGSDGCADTGPGCHPTADLLSVGAPTTSGGVHRDCLRCHDKNASMGNAAYNPEHKTCGSNRGCHSASGAYDPDTGRHFGAGKSRTDGRDAAHHTAGERQSDDVLVDSASGLKVECDVCHDMRLGPEHERPNSAMTTPSCSGCHNHSIGVATVVKADWPGRSTDGACDACHDQSGMDLPHTRVADVHEATEISRFGEPEVGACAEPGCHSAIDVRVVHKNVGCAIEGCHGTDGDIFGSRIMSCGGPDDTEGSCHTSSERHFHMTESHFATEINRYGEPEEGSCAEPGCHPTNYTRDLHTTYRCSTAGCHEEGGPTYNSCGGAEGQDNCHIGYGPDEHFVSHAADLTGTVEGVPYDVGTNIGCLGVCHSTDLVTEHADQLVAGLDGGGDTVCSVCHYNEDDPGAGAFAGLPAVTNAIAGHDRRCVSCHASGSATDGPDAVASPPGTCVPSVPAPASVEPNSTVEPRLAQAMPSEESSSGAIADKRTPGSSDEETATDTPIPDESEDAQSEESSATGGAADDSADEPAEDPVEEPKDESQEGSGECPEDGSGESDGEVSDSVSQDGRTEVCLDCHELCTEEAVD